VEIQNIYCVLLLLFFEVISLKYIQHYKRTRRKLQQLAKLRMQGSESGGPSRRRRTGVWERSPRRCSDFTAFFL